MRGKRIGGSSSDVDTESPSEINDDDGNDKRKNVRRSTRRRLRYDA